MVTADIGGMASSPEWMFRAGGTFFNLTGNITQILFDGGTLKAKSRAAEQALVQVGAQYRSTVITALQNVADTLHAIQADAEALKAAAQSQSNATPEEFYKLHDFAVDAVRRALPTARVGGPDVAGERGGKFMEDFLAHCARGRN